MAVFNRPNRVSGRVLGRGGVTLHGATITVTRDGSTATLYSDPDLTQTRANPIVSSKGDFEFYVPPGTYSLAYAGSDRYTHANPEEVVVIDSDEVVAADSATNLVTRLAGLAPIKRPFVPGTAKLRGGNLTIKAGGSWLLYWGTDWDWENWVKFQVDLAIEQGFNGIRQIGRLSGVATGDLTLSTYLTRWRQLIEYAADNDLYVYPCIDAFPYHGAATTAEVVALVDDFCAVLDESNVIAIDVNNELGGTGPYSGGAWDTLLADATSLINAVRAATDIPVTVSGIGSTALGDIGFVGGVETLVDFFDGHWWSTPTVTALNFLFNNTAKPLLLGEFGQALSDGAAAQEARYKAVRDFLATRPEVIGSFVWALTDQDAATSGQYGIYDAAGVERTNLTAILDTFPQSMGAPWEASFTAGPLTITSTVAWKTFGSLFQLRLGRPCLVQVTAIVPVTNGATPQGHSMRVRVNGGAIDLYADGAGKGAASSTSYLIIDEFVPLAAGAHTFQAQISNDTGTAGADVAELSTFKIRIHGV